MLNLSQQCLDVILEPVSHLLLELVSFLIHLVVLSLDIRNIALSLSH